MKRLVLIMRVALCLGLPTSLLAQDSLNVRSVGRWPFGPAFAVAVDSARNLTVLGSEGGIYLLDTTDPSAPVKLSEITTPGFVQDIALSSDYVYVADSWSGLRVIDVSNPAAPFEAGFYVTPGVAQGIAVSGDYAYVADFLAGLRIIDVSNPAAPFEAGFYVTPGVAQGIAVSGDYAYVADGSAGLIILEYIEVGVEEESSKFNVQSSRAKLLQNTPNPFHHSTTIGYIISSGEEKTPVRMAVYDITGRLVETLVDEGQEPGVHQIEWKAKDQAGGIYFYRLQAGDFRATRKMILLK